MKQHISYEYTMMNIVGDAWCNQGKIESDVAHNMCGIVVYNAIQNLANYLCKEKGVVLPSDIDVILCKIHNQITTLTDARTDITEEKLQAKDFMKIWAWIEEQKDLLGVS